MRRTWWLLAAALFPSACVNTNALSGGPESPIRLDVPAAVGWEPSGPFTLELTIHNATGHRISMVKPLEEAAQVKVFRLDGTLACKTLSPTIRNYEGWDARLIHPQDSLKLRVEVWPYCKSLSDGVYRYEAFYVANASSTATDVFVGTLGPQGGMVAIGEGLSNDDGALAATVAAATKKPAPAAEEAASPPPAPAPASAAAPASPAPAAESAPATESTPAATAAAPAASPAPAAPAPAASVPPAPPAKPLNPDAVRACVDRELAARGLNAYGDPQGTKYDQPPVAEGGRILYVASRNVDIRVACGIPGF
ncbi:MAG TPA: hypothetical protein VFG59_07270 [Anaeromyxobacter sp.]|nr:hypothetical protein [Anaeromyxobacter sp.]